MTVTQMSMRRKMMVLTTERYWREFVEKENLKALLQVSLRIAKITMGREVVTQSNHLEVNCWHQRHIVFVVSMKRTGTETSASRWIISESRQEKEIGRTRTQATSRKAVSALK
ncbi:hypothetical protein Tco_1034358, partial [Tanacetum coccineum]